MFILRAILLAIEVIVSLLLILIILMQKSKSGGGGLGTAFGGGMSESLFGSRAGNVLTKATIVLAIIFTVNTLILGILVTNAHEGSLMGDVAAPTAPVAPPAQAPAPVQPEAAPAAPEGVAPIAVPRPQVAPAPAPDTAPTLFSPADEEAETAPPAE